MRIISPYADYYDAFQDGTGRIWERHPDATDQLPEGLTDFLQALPREVTRHFSDNQDPRYLQHSTGVLFFCGVAYLIWRPRCTRVRPATVQEEKIARREAKRLSGQRYEPELEYLPEPHFLQEAQNRVAHLRVPTDWFLTLGVPYFLVTRNVPGRRYWQTVNGWTEHNPRGKWLAHLTPRLQDLDFPKILGAPACYQELRVYLDNILLPVEKGVTTTGDDATIAQQKGFDRWSFRKEPTRKTPR